MPHPPLASGGQENEKPRLIAPTFGDGYKQSSADGLNAVALTVAYSWRLKRTEIGPVLAFLRGHVGVTFYWTLPFESSPRKWQTPQGWNTVRGVTRDVLTINFEERFDLTFLTGWAPIWAASGGKRWRWRR